MKIAINGCGIGGPTLAYWLLEYGFEPVLFEKAPQLRTGGHVIDFWGPGYDVASKMGLLPAMSKTAYLMEHVRTVSASGRTTSHMDVSGFGELTNGRYLSIARSDLSAIIAEACKDIDTRFGTSITTIEDRNDKVIATLSDGSQEEFDLVIGADGLHSSIRAMAFGEEASFEKPMGFSVAAFRSFGYPHRDDLSYLSHTVPGKQVSRVSLRNDETLFLFIFANEHVDCELKTPAEQRAALHDIFGDMGWETKEILAQLKDDTDLYLDRVSQIRMANWAKGRVALVGDAAACPSLLAGEGTGLAMVEAYVLAGELKRANGDHTIAFVAYEKRLMAMVERQQDAALRFTGFFAPKSRFGLFVRDLLTNAIRMPYIGQRILERTFVSDFELPDYSQ